MDTCPDCQRLTQYLAEHNFLPDPIAALDGLRNACIAQAQQIVEFMQSDSRSVAHMLTEYGASEEDLAHIPMMHTTALDYANIPEEQ